MEIVACLLVTAVVIYLVESRKAAHRRLAAAVEILREYGEASPMDAVEAQIRITERRTAVQ